MLADAEALREVHWLLGALVGDLRIAASLLEMAPSSAADDELAAARHHAIEASEVSGALADRLTLAMQLYSFVEGSAEKLVEHGAALLAYFAGAAFTGSVLTTFGPSAIPIALAAPWVVRDAVDNEGVVGPEEFGISPQMNAALSDPTVIEALRLAVSSSDDAARGALGYPAMLEAALASVGVTGVSSTAILLASYGSFAGLLTETPVTVARTDTRPTATTTGFEERIAKIPQPGEAGAPQIRIDTIETAGAAPRFEVYIGGTVDFSPLPGRDAFDLTSNVAGVAGLPAGSLRAVEQAMVDAGVTSMSEVTFTGHSQGGLVAALLASSGEYNTRGVVTIGAPAGNIVLPAGIPAVIVENVEDFVPALGGVQTNHDALVVRNNVFPDRTPLPAVSAPGHRIEAYLTTGAAMDAASSGRITEFGRELDEFSAGANSVTSTYYFASRER